MRDGLQTFRETVVRLDGVEQAFKVYHVEDWRKFFRQRIVKNAKVRCDTPDQNYRAVVQ